MRAAPRIVRRADADALAMTRSQAVADGLLADLGGAATRIFFRTLLEDSSSFGFVTEDRDGIAGYVVLSTAAARIERRVLARNPWLWIRGLLALRSSTAVKRSLNHLGAILRPKRRSEAADPEPPLRLLDIVVAPRARGRGLGRALVDAALAEASRRGYRGVGLSVLEDNVAAYRLYEATGFRVARRGVRSDQRPYLLMRVNVARDTASEEGSRPTKPRALDK